MKYIDTHAHYLARQFAKDRNELIPQLLNTDLECIIECGTNALNNRIVIKTCEKFDKVFGVIGFFPTNVSKILL